MRRCSADKRVITSEIISTADGGKSGGQVIGINLGWDSCAEHEHGIKHIKEMFGVPEQPHRRRILKDIVGASARTITRVSRGLKFLENKNGYAYLISGEKEWGADESAKIFNQCLEGYNEDLETAWVDCSSRGWFGVRMKNDALKSGTTVLGQIYNAFRRHDAMIFLVGADNPFAGSGLVIAIRSRMSKEWLVKMKEIDEDYLSLREAADKIDIKTKLTQSKKGYYALRPMWASKMKSIMGQQVRTQYPVIFYLNPHDQEKYNSGWFTVEQLLEWIDGKGPIPIISAF